MEKRYLKMLAGLARKAKRGKREWSVYVLRCAGGTLYTGIAKDVQARLKQHRSGKGAAYTRTHLPVDLLVCESGFTRSQALIREARIKSLPKEKKEALVLAAGPLDVPDGKGAPPAPGPNAMMGVGCCGRTSRCAKGSGRSRKAPASTSSVPTPASKPGSATSS